MKKKSTPQTHASNILSSSATGFSFSRRFGPATRLGFFLGLLTYVNFSLLTQAATFFADFNSGLPAGTAVFGNSIVAATGGYTNSGCLKLTTNAASQTAGFVITNDLDTGTPVVSFTATFKALVGGGTAADGFSFNFAPDVPFGPIGEEGAGTGLTVEFDTFLNTTDPNDAAPAIDVKVGGSEIASLIVPGLRPNTFVDVFIQLAPDGTLNV